MDISTDIIKQLREQCGAGIMDCRNALLKTEGDMEKALEILKEEGLIRAQKKTDRVAEQGLVEAYVHPGGRIGAMVEINCETDFVARTEDFKELAHHLAMQVAAMSPQLISEEEAVPGSNDLDPAAACLLLQPYIKDTSLTVQDVITETIAKVGENIKVSRFARFKLGEKE